MIYECRLNKVTRRHAYTGLLAIVSIYLLSHLVFGTSEYWPSSSIGIALAIGVSYITGNTKVRIEEDGETVKIEHSGMVNANIPIDSIASISLSGSRNLSKLVIVTNDRLKYFIPIKCFSRSEIERLVNALDKA